MQSVRKELIYTLQKLKVELEERYSKEFLRLTDIEEDYKFNSHGIFMQRITACLQPLIINGESPEWMVELKAYLSTKAAQPRTCFQLIEGSLAILE